jgi:hypothetical protein
VGKPNPCWKKEDNTTISLVFGVGISSPLAGHHQSTSQSGSGHGARGKNPKQRFTESQEMGLVCARRTEMAMKVKGTLGFDLSHHYVAAEAIWACTVHSTSPEIIESTNGPS